MAVILPSPPPLVIGIAVNRSSSDFSERDCLLFDLLRPHLVRAYHNATSVTQLRQDLAYVRQALEELDRGVVFLSEENRVQFCTGRARTWISEYFEPSQRSDQLPESLQRWVEHQRSLLSEEDDVPPPREPLVLEREGKRLVVSLVADHSEERRLLLLEEHAPLSAVSLESLGLTNREAEILLWITQGKTNKEIAELLYISPRTVKKHLEHVYEKLGVESRTEAMARTLQILGRHRA